MRRRVRSGRLYCALLPLELPPPPLSPRSVIDRLVAAAAAAVAAAAGESPATISLDSELGAPLLRAWAASAHAAVCADHVQRMAAFLLDTLEGAIRPQDTRGAFYDRKITFPRHPRLVRAARRSGCVAPRAVRRRRCRRCRCACRDVAAGTASAAGRGSNGEGVQRVFESDGGDGKSVVRNGRAHAAFGESARADFGGAGGGRERRRGGNVVSDWRRRWSGPCKTA
ncbi:hypothetical protein DFJ73DRAFT_528561 [Zopfochytrium polystomum]|nr:hypothetical protein DFJ73DRAFT_528561 [Zopfochytrium polystomum]